MKLPAGRRSVTGTHGWASRGEYARGTLRGSDFLDEPPLVLYYQLLNCEVTEIKRMEARKLTETVIGGAPPGSPLGSYGRDTDWRP